MSVIDQTIQTNVDRETRARVTRGSDGTLYAVYKKASDSNLYVAYSTDVGVTWTEVSSSASVATGYDGPVLAIDSQDILHVAYTKTTAVLCYRQFTIAGGWTSEETAIASSNSSPDIAVDSADNVHLAATNNSNAGINYNKRTSGTWGTASNLDTSGSGDSRPRIAVDSHSYIYIVYNDGLTGLQYLKYTGSWIGPTTIPSSTLNSSSLPSIAVDSADNVHLVYRNTSGILHYIKYTFLTDSWSVTAAVTTTAGVGNPSLSIDSSDNLNVVYYDTAGNGAIYFLQYSGSWGADTKIVDNANTTVDPEIQSTVYPIVGGLHTNIVTAGYQFTYYESTDGNATFNIRFYSSSNINFPAPQNKNYSRGASGSLAATDANLTAFTSIGYSNVLTEDSVFEDQAATNQYAVMIFKNKGNLVTDPINVTWIGKATLAASSSTVYLQIYNRNSGLWETLDSNNSSPADSTFTLTGTKSSSLTNYYDGSLWVSCRIYQLAQ